MTMFCENLILKVVSLFGFKYLSNKIIYLLYKYSDKFVLADLMAKIGASAMVKKCHITGKNVGELD